MLIKYIICLPAFLTTSLIIQQLVTLVEMYYQLRFVDDTQDLDPDGEQLQEKKAQLDKDMGFTKISSMVCHIVLGATVTAEGFFVAYDPTSQIFRYVIICGIVETMLMTIGVVIVFIKVYRISNQLFQEKLRRETK